MPLVHRPRSTCITSWKRPPAGLTAPGAWARGTAPTSEARRTWSELWETSQRQSACSPCADFGIRERPRGHASGNAPRREILDRSGASASVNDALRHGSTIPTTALAATRGPPGTEPPHPRVRQKPRSRLRHLDSGQEGTKRSAGPGHSWRIRCDRHRSFAGKRQSGRPGFPTARSAVGPVTTARQHCAHLGS